MKHYYPYDVGDASGQGLMAGSIVERSLLVD